MTPDLPAAAALARTVDDLLDVAPASGAAARTTILRDRAAPIARLTLALDEHDVAHALHADALLLHRPWRVALDRLPPSLGVLACHEPLDLALSLASTPALHRAIGVHERDTIGLRDGVPLAAVCEPDAPLTVGALRDRLRSTFGEVEAEERVYDDAHPVRVVVTARAMTPALVHAAAAAGLGAGGVVYVTGQVREPARAAARDGRVHVLAVGHRRSERWALDVLAGRLRARWPAMRVEVAGHGD